MSMAKHFRTCDEVETQVFDWGRLQWLSEPGTTDSYHMVTGVVTLNPGKGHDRHNHPGRQEVLYVLEGQGEQTVETPQGVIRKTVTPGQLIYLQAGQYHSTINTGDVPMKLLAVYEFSGPESELREAADSLLPPARQV